MIAVASFESIPSNSVPGSRKYAIVAESDSASENHLRQPVGLTEAELTACLVCISHVLSVD